MWPSSQATCSAASRPPFSSRVISASSAVDSPVVSTSVATSGRATTIHWKIRASGSLRTASSVSGGTVDRSSGISVSCGSRRTSRRSSTVIPASANSDSTSVRSKKRTWVRSSRPVSV